MFWLLACACPTFDETEVRDESSGGRGIVGEARDALMEFGALTGRDGVCLQELAVVDELEPGLEQAGGRYNPIAHDIRILWKMWPMRDTVWHEACHALDHVEAITVEHAALFPEEDIPEEDHALYPTERDRIQEAFARACEHGVHDRSVERAVEAACGTELLTEQERFLADVVYTNAHFEGIAEEPVPMTLLTREVPAPSPYAAVVAAGAVDGELLLVVQDWSGRALGGELQLVFLDPDTGATRRERFDVPLDGWSGSFWTSTDDPLLVLGRNGWAKHAWRFEDGVPARVEAPWIDAWAYDGVVHDGIAYFGTVFESFTPAGEDLVVGSLQARRLADGVEVPQSFPRDVWDRSVWPTGFAVGPDGVEMVSIEGHSRLVDGEWVLARAPTALEGLVFVDGVRVSFVAESGTLLPLVEQDGTWALPDEPCLTDRVPAAVGIPVQLGDRAFVVGPYARLAGTWPVTEILLH